MSVPQTDVHTTLDRIIAATQAKPSRTKRDQWEGKCPAHDDNNPSFGIGIGTDGRLLLSCQRGCSTESILRALGLRERDLFPGSVTPITQRPRARKAVRPAPSRETPTYLYQNESGDVVFAIVRRPDKSFAVQHPDGKGGWLYGYRNDADRTIYHLPEVLEAIKQQRKIVIVEGEKDADRLRSLNIVATTNPNGAGKWLDAYSHHFKGTDVVIIPDNDEPGREHAEAVAKSLFQVGAGEIRVVELPGIGEKGDVSDWLDSGHTVDGLKELIKACPVWVPAADVEQTNTSTGEPESPYLDGKTFIPKRLADAITSRYRFRYTHDALWVYRDGRYYPDGERVIESESRRLLGESFRHNRAIETYHYIRIGAHVEMNEPDIYHVNLKNGRYNWLTGELVEHTPDVFYTYQLPVEYDETATDPNFAKYLDTTLGADVIPIVEEVMGLLLIPYTGFEKAVMFTGEGSNGKGVLLDTIEAMLGTENVSNVALQDLEENRFRAAELVGKLANIFADLDARALRSSSMFKTLVTGDRISAERKFGQPFNFRNMARLLFSANKIPGSSDRTHAFYRRWIIIPFNRTFEGTGADKTLRDRLREPKELSGILNRALRGLARLMGAQVFSDSKTINAALEQYKIDNDTVAAFVSECCDEDGEAFVPKGTFYEHYRTWCDEYGIPNRNRVPLNKLKPALMRAMPCVTERRLDRGRGAWVWGGIALNENAPTPRN